MTNVITDQYWTVVEPALHALHIHSFQLRVATVAEEAANSHLVKGTKSSLLQVLVIHVQLILWLQLIAKHA